MCTRTSSNTTPYLLGTTEAEPDIIGAGEALRISTGKPERLSKCVRCPRSLGSALDPMMYDDGRSTIAGPMGLAYQRHRQLCVKRHEVPVEDVRPPEQCALDMQHGDTTGPAATIYLVMRICDLAVADRTTGDDDIE